ncbi:MAG: crotonase/enoyl-CoA hydratase family protein [Burkholderiales bacterium]
MSNLCDTVGLRIRYGKPQSQFQTEFDPATSTVWGYFNPHGRPCFNLGLLKDIRAHDSALAVNGGKVDIEGDLHNAKYYVCGSRVQDVFNLGGDLSLFLMLIRVKDREALANYARMCIDNMFARIQNYYASNLITISMVQGDALGGGFECALSSDVVVAEEGVQMGLPEILFNMFPGMGAYSLLARRIGMREAEKMMLSGRMMCAEELHAAGIVDVLAKRGEAEAATSEWIARCSRRHNGTQAVFRARALVQPIKREELDSIADVWVDAAFRLSEKDLRMMGRIIRSQMRLAEGSSELQALTPPLAAAG